MHFKEINRGLGNPDIYLLDQILKGRFEGKKTLLDAGCGEGRNLSYFLNNNFKITGIDTNPTAIQFCKMRFKNPEHSFRVKDIADLDGTRYDVVLCNAVLHFAPDERKFKNLFSLLSQSLEEEGILFCRLATTIGVLPELRADNFTFLATPALLKRCIAENNLTLIEPIKSVVVEEKRSMGVLVAKKI